jgi:hypothetical protein
MILINIDSLSTTELQYIAQQEGFEDWQSLDRQELIDALEEAYGEQDDENPQTNKGKLNKNRFCNSLTSYRGTMQDVNGLPGVEALPESYHDTSIHLLLRDPQWAFAYWSFSPQVIDQVLGEDRNLGGAFFLRVTQTDLTSEESTSFDIEITSEDEMWNINLSSMDASYVVDLCWRDKKGSEQSLATSKPIVVQRPYWHDNDDAFTYDMEGFNTHFASLVTKQGEIVDNSMLREIANSLSKGVL